MSVHGVALLALAHAYRVAWLKRRAEEAVAAWLTAERAVDALKLAALCDAPRLRLRCAHLASKDLAAVERSEGWRFAARHDVALQLDLLRLLHDDDQVSALALALALFDLFSCHILFFDGFVSAYNSLGEAS